MTRACPDVVIFKKNKKGRNAVSLFLVDWQGGIVLYPHFFSEDDP